MLAIAIYNFFIVWFEILRLDYHVVSDWIFSLVQHCVAFFPQKNSWKQRIY